jgi:hypothetical protein
MTNIFGREMNKYEIMQRVGDISQIAGARYSRLCDGKADGMPVIDFKTGSGFNFSVLPARSMDIAWADYKGNAISFISKTGVVNGENYEHDYDGFHRNFFAGLLTTCGLRNIGNECNDEEPLGLHGRISNTPAANISINNYWENDELVMSASGEIRESKLYCENLLLTRKITAKMGEKKLTIEDKIENCGFRKEPLTLLYHFNFGFPLLDEAAKILLPSKRVIPRDEIAKKVVDKYNTIEKPQDEFPETVFFHELERNNEGNTYAALYNKSLGETGLGIEIKYNGKELPFLTQWKNMGKGDYVVALEPGNCYPMGREKIRERDELTILEPGEIKEYKLELNILDGEKDLNNLKNWLSK